MLLGRLQHGIAHALHGCDRFDGRCLDIEPEISPNRRIEPRSRGISYRLHSDTHQVQQPLVDERQRGTNSHARHQWRDHVQDVAHPHFFRQPGGCRQQENETNDGNDHAQQGRHYARSLQKQIVAIGADLRI